MPKMAIVDVDIRHDRPKRGLTAASGIDVMTHAIEAYVSIMSSDYTDGLAEQRCQDRIRVPAPPAYENGTNDPQAREEMHNASCMAGMAFANAFLGLNHSMAHKLGAFHHIPHGLANAVILTRVMRYNAAEAPSQDGYLLAVPLPQRAARLRRHGPLLRYCRARTMQRSSRTSSLSSTELCDFIGVKKTIAEYGVDEKYFLDTLDEMTEQAFNDQCTGANPRYPLMSEIEELYLDAYYGREPPELRRLTVATSGLRGGNTQ